MSSELHTFEAFRSARPGYANISYNGTSLPLLPDPKNSTEGGSTILELLVVFAIIAILMSSGISNLKVARTPLLSASSELAGFLRQVRARSLATTSAYLVEATSATNVITSFAATCEAASFTEDPNFTLDLRDGVTMADPTWSVCISSRGLASNSLTIALADADDKTATVEIYLGGAVRVQ